MALVGLKQDRVEGAEIERFFFYSGGGVRLLWLCLSLVGLVSCVGYIGFFFNEISVVVMGRKWIMTGYQKMLMGSFFLHPCFLNPYYLSIDACVLSVEMRGKCVLVCRMYCYELVFFLFLFCSP